MISIHVDKFTEDQLKNQNITAAKIEELINYFFSTSGIKVSLLTESDRKENKLILSEKQKRILYLSSIGKTYREIADKLDIEVTTVKFHMRNIKDSLGVSSLGQAIKVATAGGLIL